MPAHKNVPFLAQLFIFLSQLGGFLFIDWLDVYHNQQLPISDTLFWSIITPATWLIYTLLAYYYSRSFLSAAIQGLLQTFVSYTLIIVIVLFFHQWLGGSF